MRLDASALPDPRVCEQARLSRDPRFDGLFYTAVTSTGIYCRPVCPVRSPKRENIRYYPTAAAAEADGFRPCLRCRPELAPGGSWSRADPSVARALKLIEEGFLAEGSVTALAGRVGVGERQLRRLFVERLGATPRSVHSTRRLLFAKQLLTETSLPIIDVALEAGFGSLRRFNSCFRDAYGLAPSELRRSRARAFARDEVLELRLGYRPPYDFPALLAFLRPRTLPGVEVVDEESYARAFGPQDAPGWLRISAWNGGEHALRLELHCPRATRLLDVVARVRRMFDLHADPETICAALGEDARLRPSIERAPGLRLPSGWDGFEIAVRSVLGRRRTVPAARALAGRLAVRLGEGLAEPSAPGLERLFPTPEALLKADLDEVGLSESESSAVRGVARALLEGRVDFRPERTLEEFVARWSALPGVGMWIAHRIALRALGHADAFPFAAAILGLADSAGLSAVELRERAESWRPWRAYAVLHLHRGEIPGLA